MLRERGQREVFCGLTGIIWLHRKIQDAFFLVVGSRTCAHLIQSAAGVMIFAEPRFATAIIDERDLAGLADANDELDRVVTRLLERRPEIKLLFLVGSCPSEVIKLDLSRAAARLSARFVAGRAGAQLFGQRHRDHLHAGRGRLPRLAGAASCRPQRPTRRPSLLVVGALADVVEDQFAPPVRRSSASAPVRFFPPRRAGDAAAGRPEHALPAGAAVPGRHRARARGARRAAARRALPARRRRHDALAAGRGAARSASTPTRFERVTAPRPRARARSAGRASAPQLAGKRIFFFPDSQLEIPIARFLARELGMQLVEVGTPYLHRQHLAEELALLPDGTVLSRRPGRRAPARPLPRRAARHRRSAASAWPIRWRPKG